jgi:4-carboxymuconolactone decarboxylase
VEQLKEMPRTYRLLLHSPALGEHVARLGEYFRFESSLDPLLRETAILSTAREIHSQYEWTHHVYIARQVGVRPEVIEAIRTGRAPLGLPPAEGVCAQVAQDMVHHRTVGEQTFQATLHLLGPAPTVDLIALVGFYIMLGSVFNALGLELEEALEPLLPE